MGGLRSVTPRGGPSLRGSRPLLARSASWPTPCRSSRPAVSQHLKILKDAGLVLDERAGSRRIYRVNQDGLNQMRVELDSFWNDTLTAYKHLVEQPTAARLRSDVA